MVGRYLVAEKRQNVRILYVTHWIRLHLQPFEIGRIAYIGRANVPFVSLAQGHLDLAPMGVTLEDIRVASLEDFLGHEFFDEGGNFRLIRPDVLEKKGAALFVVAKRVAREIGGYRAGKRVGNNEGRRGKIIRLNVWANPALEIAVA